MLVEGKKDIFSQLIKEATHDELVWMNGFLAGLLNQTGKSEYGQIGALSGSGSSTQTDQQATKLDKLTILYASETGNAKSVATKWAAASKKKGMKIKLASVEQYRLSDLPKEHHLLLAISTQGDGEPPLSAIKFYNAIQEESLQLPNLKYGVLALGDSSYPLFCQAGIDVDKAFESRGGKRLVPIQKCDTDYSGVVEDWFESAIKLLADDGATPVGRAVVKSPKPQGKKVYEGKILTNFNLNDSDSSKQTYHIEIEAQGVQYTPGDALGVVPTNTKAVVQEIFELTDIDPDLLLEWKGTEYTLETILTQKAQLVYLPERVVRKYAEIAGQEIPDTRINLVDLLKIYPLKNNEVDFLQVVQILEPIVPRLYSISSSPEAHGEELHITVAKERFYVGEKQELGLCSGFLADQQVDTSLQFYIHPNKAFRMPQDDKDIIMIGPGTGIAPFRSFLFERDANGASGRNWLFFGDQHFASDFLYQTEIQAFLETGVLSRFNGAFSRDQENKVYVQHKMREQGSALFEWLENGAYIYICGAKEPMCFDVEKTLAEIVASQKDVSLLEATAYLENLKEEGRLMKDVY